MRLNHWSSRGKCLKSELREVLQFSVFSVFCAVTVARKRDASGLDSLALTSVRATFELSNVHCAAPNLGVAEVLNI
jgi:hypothetical protein